MAGKITELRIRLFAEITTVPEFLQGSYYSTLDGLRGLSILLVLSAHFGINHYLRPYRLFVDSSIGVHIFFVLSGFLITTLLLKEKIKYDKISLKRFYLRRVLKIIPVAYLFLFVLFILNFCYRLKIIPVDFMASLLFLKNLPLGTSVFTAHLWSLAVEEQFYLTFPFLLAFSVNRYTAITLFIIIATPFVSVLGFYLPEVVFSNYTTRILTKIVMYSFWKGPLIILIGSLFSILSFKGIIKFGGKSSNRYSGFILLALAIVIHTKTFLFYNKYCSEYLSACMIGYVVLLSIKGDDLLSTILSNRFLRKIGKLSYSIYIWQELFIGGPAWQPWLQNWTVPLALIMVLKTACVLLLASVSYYLVELNFLKLKQRIRIVH